MDDQRGQQSWEVTKSWIAKNRGATAQAALESFKAQSSFVRPRGIVSGNHYFETAQVNSGDTPAQSEGYKLSVQIQGCLREACTSIPAQALSSTSDPLYLPARAITPSEETMTIYL